MAKAKKKNIDKLSFEQCIEQLQDVVMSLESGSEGLNDSLAGYEQGVAYLKRCHELLEAAEQKVQLLSGVDSEGKPITQRFDDGPTSLEDKAANRSRRRTRKPDAVPADGEADVVDDGATLF